MKYAYIFNDDHDYSSNDYTTNLTEYQNLMRPWKNTKEQKKLMLDY